MGRFRIYLHPSHEQTADYRRTEGICLSIYLILIFIFICDRTVNRTLAIGHGYDSIRNLPICVILLPKCGKPEYPEKNPRSIAEMGYGNSLT